MKLGAIFLILVFKGQAQAVEWNYTTLGADWPILVETCGGDRQSPINIQREKTIKYEGSDFVDFSTSYCGKTNGILKNNGHTLKWETEDGLPSRTSYITGGPLGDSKYYFLQFHLHWGSSSTRGSEHIIDGERASAELHLVHVKEDYINGDDWTVLPGAFEAGDGLSVLGIFLRDGGSYDDIAFQPTVGSGTPGGNTQSYQKKAITTDWFDFIPNAAYHLNEYNISQIECPVNLNQIVKRLNPTFDDEFNYWHYEGSLTTPNCNEAVQWIVAERPLIITTEQMTQLFEVREELYDFCGDNSTLAVSGRSVDSTSGSEEESGEVSEECVSPTLIDIYRREQPHNCRKINYVYRNIDTEHDFNTCEPGYFLPDPSSGPCIDCCCNLANTVDEDITCDNTGQCNCDTGFSGLTCDDGGEGDSTSGDSTPPAKGPPAKGPPAKF